MKNQTNLIFIHKLLKALADGLVSVFVPLLILKSSGSMINVIIYLSILYTLSGLLNFLLKRFLQKYGVIAIILHCIPLILIQFLLTLKLNIGLLVLLAILGSLGQTLYAVPINILFSFSDKNTNVTKFQLSTNIGKIIMILLGGYVLGSELKNSLLFLSVAGTILYLTSCIPLLYGYKLLKEKYKNVNVNPVKVDNKSYKYFNIFHIAFSNFQSVIDTVLPLYLFIKNVSFENIANIMAIKELAKMASNLFAGFLAKKNRHLLSCILSAVFLIVSSSLILIFDNLIIYYVCDCVLAFSFPMLFVPMFAKYTTKIKNDNNHFNGMTNRDIIILPAKNFLFLPYFAFQNLIGQFAVGFASALTVIYCCTKILKQPPERNTEQVT